LDGFATTNLDFILRSRGISTIALGGFLTNCCVESTMRTGYEKGYNVVTLKDCTATVSEEEQRARGREELSDVLEADDPRRVPWHARGRRDCGRRPGLYKLK
jgi:nicotinamidase-related amidase